MKSLINYLKLNSIYLRRRRKVILPDEKEILPLFYPATLLKNVETYGYTFSYNLFNRLRTLSLATLNEFHVELISFFDAFLGSDKKYKPMYPNFPIQVMQADESELFVNAYIHYTTFALPNYQEQERPEFRDWIKLKPIELGTTEDFEQIFTNLISAKSSLSNQDKEDIRVFIEVYKDNIQQLIPQTIPFKENLAYLGGLLMEHTSFAEKFLYLHYKTATDVLRLVVAMCLQDFSLAEKPHFSSINRKKRKIILSLLEKCENITEDMLRHKGYWIRLGEKLHPYEFKNKFPKVYEAFDVLRNNKKFHTFNSKVEIALSQKNTNNAIQILENRPGEYARRLDHLIRLSENTEIVLEKFRKISSKISIPVLLQVMAHFQNRNSERITTKLNLKHFQYAQKNKHSNFKLFSGEIIEQILTNVSTSIDLRVFFPKGNLAKIAVIQNQLPFIEINTCNKIVEICKQTLLEKFKSRPQLGNVFIDNSLKKVFVPLALRSASKTLNTFARGSRIALPLGDTIRFFLWWREGMVKGMPTGRVDIDLTATALDENWNYIEHISYTNLKGYYFTAVHSGDITCAPDGACEFVDISISSALNAEVRYLVMSVFSFTQHPYCNLPECYAGWMVRQFPASGEIFEPQTVQQKIDLTANTKTCLPVIIDLKSREFIWADVSLTKRLAWHNNIEENFSLTVLMSKAICNMHRPVLYDLLEIHAQARGKLSSKEKADTIFSMNEGITPLHTDLLISEYL